MQGGPSDARMQILLKDIIQPVGTGSTSVEIMEGHNLLLGSL